MPLGSDQQYNESWAEQDKIHRRMDLKRQLKMESIRARYDPYAHMKDEAFQDPAVDRYMDLRKKGRMPNAPFNPKLFFSLCCTCILPVVVMWKIIEWERKPYIEACEKGEYPVEKKYFRYVSG